MAPGTLLTFEAASINGTVPEDQLFCQMMIGGAFASIPLPLSSCVVPDGINGPVAIWVTSDGQPLINNVRDRATTQQIAGPAVAFIDTQPQLIGQLLRGGSGSGSGAAAESTQTRTISPDEASSVIAGAGGEATATASGTASGSASAPAATDANTGSSGSTAVAGNGGQPNLTTGVSGDGNITVNGWVVPPPGVDPASVSVVGSAAASATDSAAAVASSA